MSKLRRLTFLDSDVSRLRNPPSGDRPRLRADVSRNTRLAQVRRTGGVQADAAEVSDVLLPGSVPLLARDVSLEDVIFPVFDLRAVFCVFS